jgi:RNA polymerase sigma-70 factor (ECF subfamily)
MGYGDTTLGGSTRSFPTTQWSQILGAQDRTLPGYRDRLDALLRTYWRPAYAYIRVGWKKSNEDAKDLTQAFFARVLQNELLASARADGGRFRSYLKQALKNFLIDADRAAEVRRPIEPVVALDGEVDVPSGVTPDEVFDRQWLSCLLDESIARLEVELRADGKEVYWNAFHSYLLDPATAKGATVATRSGELELPTYASVASRWSLSESDVRNYLTQCRTRLREILKAAVRVTVEDPRDVEEELRSLLNE